METNQFIPLTNLNVETLIGKKIEWTAEAYGDNGWNRGAYWGIAIILSVDWSNRTPLKCKSIEGNELEYAFLDNHGLETDNGGESYSYTHNNISLSYSDGDREVFYKIID